MYSWHFHRIVFSFRLHRSVYLDVGIDSIGTVQVLTLNPTLRQEVVETTEASCKIEVPVSLFPQPLDEMMISLRILLLVAASTLLQVCRAAPSPCPNDPNIEGYTSLATLNSDIGSGGPGMTYTLCPDTSFETNCADDADLFLTQSNVTVKCGDDGSSSNACVITGGNCPLVRVGESLEGVVVQGVTIVGGEEEKTSNSVIILGGVLFEDCIWEVRPCESHVSVCTTADWFANTF